MQWSGQLVNVVVDDLLCLFVDGALMVYLQLPSLHFHVEVSR